MTPGPASSVSTLAFDIFGTVLDLQGSLVGPTGLFLASRGAAIDGLAFWRQWRDRQRIEQYQDSLLMLGHSGYLETCRRALAYCLRLNGIEHERDEADALIEAWRDLTPFSDAVDGLRRLRGHYRLVALSNGEQWLLEHLAQNRIGVELDAVVSVERAGSFKPHPAVYQTAARVLGREPGEIMMVAAHSFDIMGARACGYRGAYVNRYGLPFEDTPHRPDLEVADFNELASRLLGAE
jgi:2-haloacid dehalogenase